MKFSVSVYSFMQYIQDGRLTPFSCIEKVKEMGFDAIEYVDFVFPKAWPSPTMPWERTC